MFDSRLPLPLVAVWESNVVDAAEAFFSTFEHEVLSRHHFATKAQAREADGTQRPGFAQPIAPRRLRQQWHDPYGERRAPVGGRPRPAQVTAGCCARPRRRDDLDEVALTAGRDPATKHSAGGW